MPPRVERRLFLVLRQPGIDLFRSFRDAIALGVERHGALMILDAAGAKKGGSGLRFECRERAARAVSPGCAAGHHDSKRRNRPLQIV